jgi:hypothetical protein
MVSNRVPVVPSIVAVSASVSMAGVMMLFPGVVS